MSLLLRDHAYNIVETVGDFVQVYQDVEERRYLVVWNCHPEFLVSSKKVVALVLTCNIVVLKSKAQDILVLLSLALNDVDATSKLTSEQRKVALAP